MLTLRVLATLAYIVPTDTLGTSISATNSLPKHLNTLPDDKYGTLVRLGHSIFTDTPTYARRFSGNSLSCSNCHLDAGNKAGAAPMWAAWGMYPTYLSKYDRVSTFEERVQQCFRFSLNGFPPSLDSEEVRAVSAYSQWLAIGQPIGRELSGRGFPTLPRTGSDPNPLRGKSLYVSRCASCHGTQGQGNTNAKGYVAIPPLWGFGSYNKGAGFYRTDLLAGFLKANMPPNNQHLSIQESLDIAAWINIQIRMPDPRRGLLSGFLGP